MPAAPFLLAAEELLDRAVKAAGAVNELGSSRLMAPFVAPTPLHGAAFELPSAFRHWDGSWLCSSRRRWLDAPGGTMLLQTVVGPQQTYDPLSRASGEPPAPYPP